MQNIRIERYEQDPTAQGVIRPADNRWQLVIGADGCPHLYVRIKFTLAPSEAEALKAEPVGYGWLAIDDVLPDGQRTRDLIDSVAGEPEGLTHEEAEEAWAAYEAEREAYPMPCPR